MTQMPHLMLLLALGVLGAMPLTVAEREQLGSARDLSGAWDEPALYPLLRNAMQWPSGDARGAIVPDYAEIHANPSGHRGELILIEGEFAAAQRIEGRLSQPGEFEHNLQQWSIRIARDPDEVVVVFVVNAMPLPNVPGKGAPVRLVARFYKVWRTADQHQIPTDYLMFVGKWVPAMLAARSEQATPRSPALGIGVLVAMILLLIASAWLTIRRVRRIGRDTTVTVAQLRRQMEHESDVAVPDETLPEDPAEALNTLRRRHDSDATSSNH